jgi:hypothetical protein
MGMRGVQRPEEACRLSGVQFEVRDVDCAERSGCGFQLAVTGGEGNGSF